VNDLTSFAAENSHCTVVFLKRKSDTEVGNYFRLSVKLHLREAWTNVQMDASLSVRSFVCSFVSLSVVSVSGVHPMGETNRDAS